MRWAKQERKARQISERLRCRSYEPLRQKRMCTKERETINASALSICCSEAGETAAAGGAISKLGLF